MTFYLVDGLCKSPIPKYMTNEESKNIFFSLHFCYVYLSQANQQLTSNSHSDTATFTFDSCMAVELALTLTVGGCECVALGSAECRAITIWIARSLARWCESNPRTLLKCKWMNTNNGDLLFTNFYSIQTLHIGFSLISIVLYTYLYFVMQQFNLLTLCWFSIPTEQRKRNWKYNNFLNARIIHGIMLFLLEWILFVVVVSEEIRFVVIF